MMDAQLKSRQYNLVHVLALAILTCVVLVNSGHAAEHTFKLGNGRFVQLTLPKGWAYCTEGMGNTQIIVYYGTPGLSMIAAGQQGFDAIRVIAHKNDQSSFSASDISEFFKFEGIAGIRDTVRLSEQDDTLAVLCELNEMYRITGARLVDGHKVYADGYMRGGMFDGENFDNYLANRCRDYLTILCSARVFTDPTDIHGRSVIEIRTSAGWQRFEKILIFVLSNLKWIGLGFIVLIIGILQLIRHALRKRRNAR